MNLTKVIQAALLFALGYLLFLMLKITIPYGSMEPLTGFLIIKQWIIENDVWRAAFYTHVFSSSFLLLAGFSQFSGYIIRKAPELHKWLGRIYVFMLLGLSAPSGLIMAIYANGGVISQVAFTLLSVLWIYTTAMAYRTARNKQFERHGKFMFRSYALTLSALTLRLWKPALAEAFEIPPMTLYRIVAWLGWIPNLIIAELLIRNKSHLKLLRQIRKAR